MTKLREPTGRKARGLRTYAHFHRGKTSQSPVRRVRDKLRKRRLAGPSRAPIKSGQNGA